MNDHLPPSLLLHVSLSFSVSLLGSACPLLVKGSVDVFGTEVGSLRGSRGCIANITRGTTPWSQMTKSMFSTQ